MDPVSKVEAYNYAIHLELLKKKDVQGTYGTVPGTVGRWEAIMFITI
jgi:hypothetical protein